MRGDLGRCRGWPRTVHRCRWSSRSGGRHQSCAARGLCDASRFRRRLQFTRVQPDVHPSAETEVKFRPPERDCPHASDASQGYRLARIKVRALQRGMCPQDVRNSFSAGAAHHRSARTVQRGRGQTHHHRKSVSLRDLASRGSVVPSLQIVEPAGQRERTLIRGKDQRPRCHGRGKGNVPGSELKRGCS